MAYKETEQQLEIISAVAKDTGKIVLVKAFAGCGKTSTALLAVTLAKPKEGLYFAFNKSIVLESREKFPSSMECRTLHSLALRYVQPKLDIEPFTYLCIKERLSYPNKAKIIKAIDSFFRSASTDMHEYLNSVLEDERLETIAVKYIEGMVADTVAPTFNFLLKYFHLLMEDDLIDVSYDLVILDEIQDITAVALEIFKLIKSPKKLGLGDPQQAIYGFMGLVNGFEELDNTIELKLTKTFRCSEEVSRRIRVYGRNHLNADFEFIGNSEAKDDGYTAYISSTNASIIKTIQQFHTEKKGYVLTNKISEIFACPLALVTAAAGKRILHKQYKFLEKEYKQYSLSGKKGFFGYLNEKTKDPEVANAVRLLLGFKEQGINIWDVMKDAKAAKKNSAITVATAHSIKGMEYGTVYIADDLNTSVNKIISKGGPETESDFTMLKLGYVAASRTKVNLRGCSYL